MKRLIGILFILIGLSALGFWAYFRWSPITHIRSVNLIPSDAIYFIEITQPINGWKAIQESDLWNELRNHEYFSDINQKANFIDSLIENNPLIAKTFANQPLIISAHMTDAKNYDFLCIWAMHDIATRLGAVKKTLLSLSDYKVTQRNYHQKTIYELTHPDEKNALFLCFLEDHLLASYSPKLIYKSIQSAQKTELADNQSFIKIQELVKGREYFTIYFNPNQFNRFLQIYLKDLGNLKDLHHWINFSAFQVNFDNKKIHFHGYVLPNDTSLSFLTTMLNSGAGNRLSEPILSDRLAWFISLGFEDFLNFYDEFENQLKNNPKIYEEHKRNLDKIEKLLKINIKKDFISWISDEVCLVANKPMDSTFQQPELLVYLHTNNIDIAKERIQFILKQVKKRTKIVKNKSYEYKGFEIHHFQVKGLFKLLFGKLFQKFDMPYVTFIEDFVVFSLDELALQSAIDDYNEKKFLKNLDGFSSFSNGFKVQNSVYAYLNMNNFYNLLPNYLSTKVWLNLQNNENYIRLFEHIGIQMTAEKDKFYTKIQIN